MVTPRTEREDSPVFSHQVLALLARMAREDRELIGAFYRRAQSREKGVSFAHFHARLAALPVINAGAGGSLYLPSPLGRDRQTGAIRVPHFDMKPITKCIVPTNRDGVPHARYKNAAMSAAKHFAYLVDGAELTFRSHLDYLQREEAVEHVGETLPLVDLADEQELRRRKQALAVYSNIPGGPERQRSLFAAAEACEQKPKKHYLTLSTADLDRIASIARFATSPSWIYGMERRLRLGRRKLEADATKSGKPLKDRQITVADVTPDQAFDILDWFASHPRAPQPQWKQGKTGRNHHRFVGELPRGISSTERHEIMRGFVDMLARDGWMAVGAIHQPDEHNDPRNYHFHVDAYDRPSKWLEKEEC